MLKERPFITWLIGAGIILTGAFWAWWFGIAGLILDHDKTFITAIIAGIVVFLIAKIGWIAYNIEFRNFWNYLKIREALETCQYHGSRLVSLGIFGTVAGLIIFFFSDFATLLDDPSTDDILAIIVSTLAGIGTALFTTAAGLAGDYLINYLAFFVGKNTGIEDNDS